MSDGMRRGFTLIELLVVMGIVAMLIGLLMPIVGIADRSAANTNSVSVMKKVDTALRLFRTETGTYPYMAEDKAKDADTDLAPGRGNRLWHFLGTPMGSAQLGKLQTDLQAVDAVFAYDLKSSTTPKTAPSESGKTYNALAFTAARVLPGPAAWDPDDKRYEATGGTNVDAAKWGYKVANTATDAISCGHAAYLNRLATERYRLAVLAGNIGIKGWKSQSVVYTIIGGATTTYPGTDNSGTAVLSAPATTSAPGWCGDYLAGQIETRFVQGFDILDAYGSPLIYLCPVVSGVRAVNSWVVYPKHSWCSYSITEEVYGLDAEGRPSRAMPRLRHPTGQVVSAPADPLASDRRFWAEPGRELDLELWSAGRDGSFCGRRNHSKNRDNIPMFKYDRNLLP